MDLLKNESLGAIVKKPSIIQNNPSVANIGTIVDFQKRVSSKNINMLYKQDSLRNKFLGQNQSNSKLVVKDINDLSMDELQTQLEQVSEELARLDDINSTLKKQYDYKSLEFAHRESDLIKTINALSSKQK